MLGHLTFGIRALQSELFDLIQLALRRAHQELAGGHADHLRLEGAPRGRFVPGGRFLHRAAGEIDVLPHPGGRQVGEIGVGLLRRSAGQQRPQQAPAQEFLQGASADVDFFLALRLPPHIPPGDLRPLFLRPPEAALQVDQVVGALGEQVEQAGMVLLDDHHLGQPHWLDDLAQILPVLRQPPQQQKYIQRALDAPRVGVQPHGKDRLAAGIGQARPGHLFYIVLHRLRRDGRQRKWDLDDLFQVLGPVQRALIVLVADPDPLLDHLPGDAQQEYAARHVEKELDRLQHLHRPVGQAAVQVVDEHHQAAAIDDALLAQVFELAAKVVQGRDLVPAGAGLALLHIGGKARQPPSPVLVAGPLRLAAQQLQPHQRRQCRPLQARQRPRGQHQMPSRGRRHPVDPRLQAGQRVQRFLVLSQKAAGAVDDARDQGPPQRPLPAVEPGVEPHRAHRDFRIGILLQLALHHAHQAGLAPPPIAKDADGKRGAGTRCGDDLGQRAGIGRESQPVSVGRLVGEDR